MKRELKAQWLEALRSGKYEQGQFMLRSGDDKYCCLGVLCDISGQGQWKEEGYGARYSYWKGEESDQNVLPQFVSDFTNLSDAEEEMLIDKNDGDGLSFKEIADWIEENVEED